MTQARRTHPLGLSPYRGELRRRLEDIWLIVTGKWSLHRAWQKGYDDHNRNEGMRRARGGR